MIDLELQPELEAQLALEAKACGMPLDLYVIMLIESHLAGLPESEAPGSAYDLNLKRNLEQGLNEIAAGKTRPAREVFAELNEEFGIVG